MHDFRSFLAGLGSSGALIAAALVAFLTLGGLVAIKGLPESSEPAAGRSVLVEAEPAAVTADAVTGGDRSQRAPSDRQDSRGGDSGSGRGDGGSSAPDGGGPIPEPVAPVPGPTDPPGLTPPPTNPGTPAPPDPEPQPEPEPEPQPDPQTPSPSQGPQPPGAIGGLVDDVDQVVDDAIGFNPSIGQSIRPITGPVDQVIGGLGLPPGAIPQLPGLPGSGG